MKRLNDLPWLLLAALIFLCLSASSCDGDDDPTVEAVDCHGDVFVEHITVARVTPAPRETYSDGSTHTWDAPPYGVEVTGSDGEAVMRIYSAANVQLAKYTIYAADVANGDVSVNKWNGLSEISFNAGNFIIEDNGSQDRCNLDLFAGGVGVSAVGTKYLITVRPERNEVIIAVLDGRVILTRPGWTVTLDASRPYEAMAIIQDGDLLPLLPIEDRNRLLEDVTNGQDIMIPTIEIPSETLTMWADDRLLPELQKIAAQFESETGIKVEITAMPLFDIDQNYAVAAQAGDLPDIVTLPHQEMYQFVSSGYFLPVESGFDPGLLVTVALQAFTYKGTLYGIPYAYDNLALISNPEFVSGIPPTWSELRGYAAELAAGIESGTGLIIPADGYYFYPVQSAFGGYIFGSFGDGTFNPQDLGMGSDGSLASAAWFADLLDSQPRLIGDENQAVQYFVERRVAMIVSGPWYLQHLRETGIPFQVNSFPDEMQQSQPLVGTYGFLISASSQNPGAAQNFVSNYLATFQAMSAYSTILTAAPARWDALESLADVELRNYGIAGAKGLPIPNLPEMDAVWSPWTDALVAILDGYRPAQDTFKTASDQIYQSINP